MKTANNTPSMDTNGVSSAGDGRGGVVFCQTSQGLEIEASLLRIAPHLVTFEIPHSHLVLRTSEVLQPCKVLINSTPIYTGRAVINKIVSNGDTLICEAQLDETWLHNGNLFVAEAGEIRAHFQDFLLHWQKLYKILPEYKLLIADMQAFLSDLRLWLQQIELRIRSKPSGDRLELGNGMLTELSVPIVSSIDSLWQRFEEIVENIDPGLRPVHRAYLRRQLHPLILCSPFAYRAFHKPLGHAGDYEVINMITRSPMEGGSLFAKLVNAWLLQQPPAEAHRNRISLLLDRLRTETARVSVSGRAARIFSIACGPAIEVQLLMEKEGIADWADISLLDFSQETIDHVAAVLMGIKQRYCRNTRLTFIKKSIQQIIKEGSRVLHAESGYDFVYCAGLFDYLSDKACQKLLETIYGWLAPGGVVIVTNVGGSPHFQHSLDFFLDWQLIYRGRQQLEVLVPELSSRGEISICSDPTGLNVFVEIRKPEK
jgi:extracellular factor (EF) 3-hydroxypalmitic acid methyl ester biosynthesis protein